VNYVRFSPKEERDYMLSVITEGKGEKSYKRVENWPKFQPGSIREGVPQQDSDWSFDGTRSSVM
jgi:hypothetical protein